MPFEQSTFIVFPILYTLACVSVCGLKEIQTAQQKDTASAEMTPLQQDKESFGALKSFALQLRLLCCFSGADAIYNVAYIGSLVSEMGYLLSFVYVNAWTSQFFIDQPNGLEDAMALSA